MSMFQLFRWPKIKTLLIFLVLLSTSIGHAFNNSFLHEGVVVRSTYSFLNYGTIPAFRVFHNKKVKKVASLKKRKQEFLVDESFHDFHDKKDKLDKKWGLYYQSIKGTGILIDKNDFIQETLALEEGEFINYYTVSSRGEALGVLSVEEMKIKFPQLESLDLTVQEFFAYEKVFENWNLYSKNYDFDIIETKQFKAYVSGVSYSPGDIEQEECAQKQWEQILRLNIINSSSAKAQNESPIKTLIIHVIDASRIPEEVLLPAPKISNDSLGQLTVYPVLNKGSCEIVTEL